MNKYDFILISIVLVISIVLIILFNSGSSEYAYVYYDGNLISTINLNVNSEYELAGYNGKVLLEVGNKKLRVKKESSPLHLCSRQGWTNNGTIVCLPNKIVIKIDSKDEIDTVVE